ncbi:MAG: FIST C-terminal domain-containing protein [Rhodospirillales bacterium]|nr:FIST C-terminal domain-containing protein [Alphaproteobacteria bacterium]MBL6948622.1 FIST C-terminal domain-containing protein [Rhodospirillales bacterium]
MTAFKYAYSDAADWAGIARNLVDGLLSGEDLAFEDGESLLGFLYVTDVISDDVGSILTYLRQTTGIDDWVGTVGIGICATGQEFFDRPAAVAMAIRLPENSYHVFPALLDEIEEFTPEARSWIEAVSPPFGIIHGDPNNQRTPGLIEGLGIVTSGFLVGGMTASRSAQPQIASDITGGGVSGVLFAPGVEVATGLTQGCLPVGPSHVVSDCVDNVIIGLDGKEALEVFKEDVGELLSRDLKRAAGYIHAAFPIEGSDTGDYVVRNLVGIDPERGWLAVGEDIQAGDRVLFVRRDPKSAEQDLITMLDNLKNRLPGPPRGGIYFSCIARGPNLFGEEGKEMAIIREHLGDVPLIGFYGNGEVSNNRIYGYTGVLALFL